MQLPVAFKASITPTLRQRALTVRPFKSFYLPMSTSSNPSKYIIKDTDSRGRGVFAACDFQRGDQVFTESITLRVPDDIHYGPSSSRIYQAVKKNITEQEREQYLQLTARTPDEDTKEELIKTFERIPTLLKTKTELEEALLIDGIWKNNCWTHDELSLIGRRRISWIGLQTSLINTSCTPNAVCQPDQQVRKVAIVANKSITAGEEVLVTYIDTMAPAATRKADLRSWGFECACPACSLTTEESQTSEARRVELQKLFGLIRDPKTTDKIVRCKNAYALLQQEPEMLIHNASVAHQLARDLELQGKHEAAIPYHEHQLSSLTLEFGRDHVETKQCEQRLELCRAKIAQGS